MDKQEVIQHALSFKFGGMSSNELSYLCDLCVNKKVLELGSMVGMSSYVIASVAQELDCVDVWSDTQEHLSHDPKQAQVYHSYISELPNMHEEFKKNCSEFLESGKITMHRGYTQKLADEFQNSHYDIVLIDADHSYEGVSRDYALYFRKVNPNGYVVFHDYGDEMWVGIMSFCHDLVNHGVVRFIENVERIAVFEIC